MTIIARRNEPNFMSNSQKVFAIWRKRAKHHRKNALPFIEPLFWLIVAISEEVKFHKTTASFICNGVEFRGKTTKEKIYFEDIKNKKEVVAITHIDEIPKAIDTLKRYK
ncbi:hypothetical protein J4458_07325 [Candidatus Woesearchaeota archaeon]|nr:hypothetical protein [Candidatus Woesearchaeota archaeon]